METATAKRPRRYGLYLALAFLLVVLTYVLAWNRANNLTSRFLAEAQASYQQGRYLEALVGYESFDQRRNRHVYHGGYIQIEAIWDDTYAWPRYKGLKEVHSKIEEIIQHKLTLEEAESFVQTYTGKKNPYLGPVFVRLGELYAQRGDKQTAKELLMEVRDLFPSDKDLIAKAEALIKTLGE